MKTSASSACRLGNGGLIDRERQIRFKFNGRSFHGYEGDSLASALLANGITLTARSFKYHRPRGIVSAGVEESGTLVELVGDEESANQPVTCVQLRDGLEARSVNCWPSPGFDLMAVNQLFSKLIPASFYYKTFKWPNWHFFEPSIRRAAGLAAAPGSLLHRGHYEVRNAHCDVLVVGAGPAGLLAALIAARSGKRVVLADDDHRPGGCLLSRPSTIDGCDALTWVGSTVEELDAMDNVTRLHSATVWAYREHNLVMITERRPANESIFQRSWRVRAKQVFIATGATERHMVFGHNDRPGVFLASALRTYACRYGVDPGRRVVLFANNNRIYDVATDLASAGINVVAVIDSRASAGVSTDSKSVADVYSNHVVEQCLGRKRVNGVRIRDRKSGETTTIECDVLGVSGGWNPVTHLFSQSRGSLTYDGELAAFRPGQAAQDCVCVGGATGEFTLSDALRDTVDKVTKALDIPIDSVGALPALPESPDYHIEPLWHVDVDSQMASKSFVDLLNDVTLADVHLAMREGFDAVEHVKRYTTTGMGIDQGKTGNLNAIGAIALESGKAFEEIGTTTFRSPYVPIEFGAMVGVREGSVYLSYRHTPITAWNKANGAIMYEAGARWRRPGYYPRDNETFQQSVDRESRAVRENVAVYDGSPLGKFEIKGPNALDLIQMLYTNNFDNLEIGMGRYGLMLTEDGLILDDGVCFKLAENHYLLSSSTGHADRVNQHMEFFCQVHRPTWKVHITTVTSQWANATLCGPKARELLQALDTNIDLSPDQFPFMAFRDGVVADFDARVCRVSFTGELSYEINVRSRDALPLWEKIINVGQDYGLTPVGSEANHVLRVEKGFLSLGHEADGTTDPLDLGMGWIMSKAKSDYIGKKSVRIRRESGMPRRELVGLLPEDPDHLIDENAPITPGGEARPSEGLVTACVFSVVNQRVIALALLENGRERIGETVFIRREGSVVSATVTAPCFHDPGGERLRS